MRAASFEPATLPAARSVPASGFVAFQGMCMLKLFSAFVMVLLATAANAQEWLYEDASVPIAYFDNGEA